MRPQHRWSRSVTAEWTNQRRHGVSGGRRFSVQQHAKGMLMEFRSVRVCPRGIVAVVFFTNNSRWDRETTSVGSCGIKWSRRTGVIFFSWVFALFLWAGIARCHNYRALYLQTTGCGAKMFSFLYVYIYIYFFCSAPLQKLHVKLFFKLPVTVIPVFESWFCTYLKEELSVFVDSSTPFWQNL